MSSTVICREELDRKRDIIENVSVPYGRGGSVIDDLDYIYQHAPRSAEPLGMLILGPTGVGKTTLAKLFEAKYPPCRTGRTQHKPVLRVTVPENAKPRSLAQALLRSLGDPRWDKGTQANLTLRLLDYLRDFGVRVLILDEIQQFVDPDANKLNAKAADWLKNLIKDDEVRLGLVLVGMPGDSELLLMASHGQLERFFGDARRLGPLSWGDGTETKPCEFRRFLEKLEEKLLPVLEGSSHLADTNTAHRIYVATGGMISFVMKLVRQAAYLAIEAGRDHIESEDLCFAYDGHLAGDRHDVPNPFRNGPLPEIPAYDYTRQSDSSPAGTNNRGAARGKGRGRGKPKRSAGGDTRRVDTVLGS